MDFSRKSETAKVFFEKLEKYYRDLAALDALGKDLENRMRQTPELKEAAQLLFKPESNFVLRRPTTLSLGEGTRKFRRKKKKDKPEAKSKEEKTRLASERSPEKEEGEVE